MVAMAESAADGEKRRRAADGPAADGGDGGDTEELQRLHRRCCSLLRRARYEEATEHCDQLLRLAPHWWKAHAVRARVHLEAGKEAADEERLEKAVEAFNWTLDLVRLCHGSGTSGTNGTSGTSSSGGASGSEVGKKAEEGREIASELIELHNDRGVALLELSNLDEAKKAFLHTLELCPDHDRALCNLGLVQWQEGRERVALSTFDKAVASNMRNAHSLNNRGALRLEWGEYEAALPDFHAAIALEPWYTTALRNRDQALSELSEPVPLPPVDEEDD